jgi:hypothetical protein
MQNGIVLFRPPQVLPLKTCHLFSYIQHTCIFLFLRALFATNLINPTRYYMQKNPVKHTLSLALSLVFIMLLPSCKIVKGLRYMNKKHVSVYDLKTPGKTVKMIPIMHFGTNAFFDDLKEKVLKYKRDGFVVYYEQMKARREQFSLSDGEYATLRRKYRYVSNGGASRKNYDELKTAFKNKRSQPLYKDLGITASDVNADINISDLVNEYEQRYGKIVLDSCNLHAPFDSAYTCKGSHKNLKPIRIDYRNQYVTNLVKTSADKKILILYGYGHKKGIKKLLKK